MRILTGRILWDASFFMEDWGKPKDVNKTKTAYGTNEQWIYSGNRYLYFDDGELTAIQD